MFEIISFFVFFDRFCATDCQILS